MCDFLQQLNKQKDECNIVFVVTIFFIVTSFAYAPFFVDDIIYPKILSFGSIGMLLLLFSKGDMAIYLCGKKLVWSVLALLFYILVRHNGYFSVFVPIILVSVMLLLFFSERKVPNDVVGRASLIVSIGAVIICSAQSFGLMRFYESFLFTGIFDNPSGVSVLMSLCFPFVLEQWFKDRSWTTMVIIVLIVMCVVLIQSRSGILAMLLSSLMVIDINKKVNSKQTVLVLSVGLLLLICLFVLKNNSTMGRFFLYSNTLTLLKKNLFLGYGPWGYETNVMNIQAEYFMKHKLSVYGDLAGEMRHPLCEPLLLLVNYGLVGFFLLLWICSEIYKSWKQRRSVWHCCLAAFVVQSLFTYTMRYPSTWFVVILCLSQIVSGTQGIKVKKFVLPKGIVIVVLLWGSLAIGNDAKYEYQWYRQTKQEEVDLVSLEQMANNWNGNPLFFRSYAEILQNEFLFDRSNNMLERYNQYIIDFNSQIMIADNYYAMGQYKEAMSYYYKASYMCPVRFVPMKGMMRTYRRMDMNEEACQIARDIILKKPKINSFDVELIKSEARKQLWQK